MVKLLYCQWMGFKEKPSNLEKVLGEIGFNKIEESNPEKNEVIMHNYFHSNGRVFFTYHDGIYKGDPQKEHSFVSHGMFFCNDTDTTSKIKQNIYVEIMGKNFDIILEPPSVKPFVYSSLK